jgi:hypothetical protein
VTLTPQRRDADAGMDAFAQAWAADVSRITYVPMRWPDKVAFLRQQTQRLATALGGEPFRDTVGYQVGAALVAADFAAPEALAVTVALLHTHLASCLGLPASRAQGVARLAQAVSIGHCRAVRDRALDGQDVVCRAAVQARHTAEKQLRAEQARARHAARRAQWSGQRRDQRVVAAQPDVVAADLGVTEPGALLLLAVDPAQHRVDIHKGQRVGTGQQRHPADQGVAGSGLQLPYMTMAERAQERTQRRPREFMCLSCGSAFCSLP